MSVGDSITSPNTGKTYRLNRRLGEGGYGVVFSAIDTSDKTKVAVKVAQVRNLDDRAYVNELAAFRALSKAPNCQQYIVCLYDDFRIGDTAYEIQELMDGDMFDYRPTPINRVLVLSDLLAGLAYIHNKGLAHQDIKPENVLYKGTQYKMGDPGLVCSSTDRQFFECGGSGTPNYIAPELIAAKRGITTAQAQRGDIWGLGATFYAIFTGTMPYSLPVTSQASVRELKLPEDSGLVKASTINNIVNAMLRFNPTERKSVDQILVYLNKKMAAAIPEAPVRTPSKVAKTAAVKPTVRTPGKAGRPVIPAARPVVASPAVVPMQLIAPPPPPAVCQIEGEPDLAADQLSGILTRLGVAHNPADDPVNLCVLVRENYPCNLIQGVPLSTQDLVQIATLYGLDATGSRAKLCKTIRTALAAQNLIDKRRVSSVLFDAVKEVTDAQIKGNVPLAQSLEARIRTFVALDPNTVDKAYLEQQFQIINNTIAQEALQTAYNVRLRDNLLALRTIIP